MTRIIAGQWRSRRLTVPSGRDIRPTTDRMRERLFSMLTGGPYPALEGAKILDLFSGTGALGLEALSRGAAHATFVEQAPASLSCLKDNIASLDATDCTTVVRGNAARPTKSNQSADLIFMDPPYRKDLLSPALENCIAAGWIDEKTVVVAECASDEGFEPPIEFEILDDRTQGQQRILFLKLSTDPDERQ